jgi:hypothetical protein
MKILTIISLSLEIPGRSTFNLLTLLPSQQSASPAPDLLSQKTHFLD